MSFPSASPFPTLFLPPPPFYRLGGFEGNENLLTVVLAIRAKEAVEKLTGEKVTAKH